MEGRERTAPWLLILVLCLILILALSLWLILLILLPYRTLLLLPIPRLSLPMRLCTNILRAKPSSGRIPSTMIPCPSARSVLSWKVTSVALCVWVFARLLVVASTYCEVSDR